MIPMLKVNEDEVLSKFSEYEVNVVNKVTLEEDFYYFCRYFFAAREKTHFVQNWHHEVLTSTLEEISEYKIGNTVFNIPPRYGKTEIVVIMFIAWCLARNPRAKFIHLSYSDDLALDNSSKVKELIEMPEFQEYWPIALKRDSKSKKKWYTEQGGGVYAGAAGGAVRGFGAGLLTDGPGELFGGAVIIDDPLKASTSYIPEKELQDVNERLNNTISSRRNSYQYTPIIIIMQRLHVNDMSGFVLGNGMNEVFHHVMLPAIQPDDTPLWEYKHNIQQLKTMQMADVQVFAGQFQQQPVPSGGAEFKVENYQFYEGINSYGGMNIYIIVDPGGDRKKKGADFTAIRVWALHTDNNYYLVNTVRDRLNSTERVNKIFSLQKKYSALCGKPVPVIYKVRSFIVESHYIKERMNKENYRFPLIEVNERGDKNERIRRMIPATEERRFYLPRSFNYVDYMGKNKDLVKDFLDHEVAVFPVSAHDDMLDADSELFNKELEHVIMFPRLQSRSNTVEQPRSIYDM